MVVFGGSNSGGRLGDVWALSLAESPAWSTLTPTGAPPSVRDFHSAVYEPVRDRMIVFGGPGLRDVWALAFAGTTTWSALSPVGTLPAARYGHTAIYDLARDRMVVFAGLSPNDYFRDVWALSFSEPPAWSAVAPAGTPPAPRYGHTAIYDPVRDRMIVLGGERRHDTWALNWHAPVSVFDRVDVLGRGFQLARPRPNPSRAETFVEFDLKKPEKVLLEAFDAGGRRIKLIADDWFTRGRHVMTWRGEDDRGQAVAAGVYFIRMKVGVSQTTRQTVRVR